MWPWEHVLFGYVLYSLFVHARYRRPPDDREAVLVATAAVLPDLIDKPLAWQFGIFPSGYALGHSVFFAAAVAAGVYVLAWRHDAPELGAAFAVGYFSHLLGDVIPIYVRTGEVYVGHLLWPVVVEQGAPHTSFGDGVRHFLSQYLAQIVTLSPTPYMLMSILLFCLALSLWVYDGFPGLRLVYDWE